LYGLTINTGTLLLIVATLVALVARRFRLPYTVGLVVTGLALTLAHVGLDVKLTRDLIFNLLLPPLLFEAAINIKWSELKKDASPIGILVTIGVLISAMVVAFAMTFVLHWPWQASMIFGVLIAATDPVSVIATFREANVRGRLMLLVESESLLNDGTAASFFAVALIIAAGGTTSAVMPALITTIAGGIAVGLACGAAGVLIASRTPDHLVETTLTTVVAFGSFSLAEQLGGSGVLATVTAGLLMGNFGAMDTGELRHFTSRGREVLLAFWDFAAFVSNSLIFLLIGLRGGRIPFHNAGALALGTAIVAVLIGRAVSVYPLCWFMRNSERCIETKYQHVLWWGGLRGALALALSLSLPESIPMRDGIIICTFGVVAFSTIVQGSTMPALLRRLGLLPARERLGKPEAAMDEEESVSVPRRRVTEPKKPAIDRETGS
jgi:CPA1 family monovalent cation:H+ antiporter